MSNPVVGIDIMARIDGFRAELAKIGPIGTAEMKALTAVFVKEIKAQEAAAKKAAKEAEKRDKESVKRAKAAAAALKEWRAEADKAADKAADLGDAAGKAGSGVGKLAGGLDLLVPGLGSMAQAGADAFDVIEVGAGVAEGAGLGMGLLSGAMAAVAAAALPLAGYIAVLNRETAEADARAQFLAGHMYDLRDATRAQEDAALDAAVATKRLSTEQAELQKIRDAANRSVEDFVQGHESERQAAEASFFANQRWLDRLEYLPDVLATAANYYGGFSSAQEEARWTLAQLDRKEAEHQDRVVETVEAQEVATKATNDRKAGVAALKTRIDALNAAMERERVMAEEVATAYHAPIDALIGMEDAARASMATEEERLKLTWDAAEATAQAERDKALSVATETGARETAEQQYRQTSKALEEAYYADLAEIQDKADKEAAEKRDKEKEDTKKEAEQLAQTYRDAASLAADAAGQISEAFGDAYATMTENATQMMEWQDAAQGHLTKSQEKELRKRIKAQQKAAVAAFEAQKIASMAEAAINTALAVSEASTSAPPPYNLIPMGVALASGLAQEAAIASTSAPTFHRGGPVDLAPDEMAATVRDQEFVLNPTGRGSFGDDALHRANAGAPVGGGEVIAVSVYRHTRQVDRWKRDGLLAGDPISRAISAGKMVGHRAR